MWTQTAGTTVALSSATAAEPTFTAPDPAAGAMLTFSLVVNDGTNASAPDTVDIVVTADDDALVPPADTTPPTATWTPPDSLTVGTEIMVIVPTNVSADVPSTGGYAVKSGSALPSGLSLNTDTGAITGTPITPGEEVTTVIEVTDMAGNTTDVSIDFPEVMAADIDDPLPPLVSEFLLSRADALIRSQPRLTRFLDTPANDQGLSLNFGADGDGGRQGRIDGAFARDRLWGEITGSWSEGTTGNTTTDSHYILGTLGAHRRIDETWLVGAMLQLDSTAEDLAKDGATGRIEGRGWLIGPYAVGRPWDAPLTIEARLLAGRSGNDLTYTEAGRTRTGAFDGDLWLAQVRVEGDVPLSWSTLTPYADGAWTRDGAAAFTAGSTRVDAQSVSLGQLDLGADIAVPLATDTGALTLTAGVGLVLSHRDATSGDEDRVPSARGTLKFGLDYRLDDTLSAIFEATNDGMGTGDYSRIGLRFGLDWRF